MRTLKDIGEFGFIDLIRTNAAAPKNVVIGIGDDTAVLKYTKDKYQLLTTDFLIEGRHFTKKSAAGFEIGWKAMARNLSDIAAMGGLPKYAVVGFAAPPTTSIQFAAEIYRGIQKAAQKFSCAVVGGDTAKDSKIVLSITILGEVQKKQLVLRSGAKTGDILFCTGTLGGSIHKKHKSFTPRIEESQFLTKHFKIHAMLDISDGLVQDLGHILKASDKGAVLFADKIPVADIVRRGRVTRPGRGNPAPTSELNHALYDGEDYELLFTTSEKEAEKIERAWKQKMKTKLSAIGVVSKKKGIRLVTRENKIQKIQIKGYRHF